MDLSQFTIDELLDLREQIDAELESRPAEEDLEEEQSGVVGRKRTASGTELERSGLSSDMREVYALFPNLNSDILDHTIIVTGISNRITENDIVNKINRYTQVYDIKMIKDPQNRFSKKAYVVVENVVTPIRYLNQTELDGMILNVSKLI